MMATEAKKTLLLRITGEVDPSLGKAVKEQEKFIDGLSKVTKDSQEEQLKDLESFVKKLGGLKASAKEAWQQYVKSAGLAEKKTGKLSNALKNFSNVLRGAAQGLKRVGEMLLALVIHDVILAGWRRLAALVKQAAARVKDFIRTSIGLAATFDEVEKGYTALLGSIEATDVFLNRVRETANRTGQSFLELAQASKSLIPYAKGSAETFQQLLDTLSLLRAFRPEMGPTGAMIAITEAMAGQMRSLQYRYNVSASLIQQLQAEGYESLELIQEALKRMGVTSAIVEAQATTWRGLLASVKGVIQEAMAALAEGPFREMIADLQTLKAWLLENRTQIILFATEIGSRLANAYRQVRQVLVSVFSPDVLMDIFRWGVDFSASLARGIISGISFVLNAIRAVMSALTGRPMQLPTVSTGARKVTEGRRGGVVPTAPSGAPGAVVPPTATPEATEQQEQFNQALADQAAAQDRVNAATAAYQLAQEKVAQLQERIRLWTIETADVPERYKRAARNMWERRLIAARAQARLRQQELQTAQQALQVARQQAQAAQEVAQAVEGVTDAWADWSLALGDVTTDTEGLSGVWADMLGYIDTAFSGIGDDLADLALQFNDILLQWPAAFGALKERFSSIVAGLQSIVDWYDGQPKWVQNILKAIGATVAIGLVLHWITAGLSTALATTLVSLGIKALSALGVTSALTTIGLPIALVFAVVLGLTEILDEAAQLVGIEVIGPGDWIRGIKLRLDEGDTFIEAIQGTFDEIATRLADWLNNVIGPIWQSDPITAALIGFALGGIPGAIGLAQQAGEGMGETWISLAQQAGEEMGEETASTWIQGLRDRLSDSAEEMEEAAKTGIYDPVTGVAQDVDDELTGKSIFPEMIDAILKLFRELPNKLQPAMMRLLELIVNTGRAAAQWWDYYMVSMSNSLQGFVNSLYAAISAIQHYLATVAQMSIPTVPTLPPGTYPGPGPEEFQMGGYVSRLQMALLHPGEVVLNVAQQKNVAAGLVGAMPQAGLGKMVDVHVEQQIVVGDIPDTRKIKRLVKEGTFEAVSEVFKSA